ncbi:MAG: hypothetical protein ABH812_01535 [bacterium]
MKTFGIILLSIGFALFIFIIYLFLKDRDRIISPIPQNTGVKVIVVTPGP